MSMTATMDDNMLDSIVEQAISLRAPLRLLWGDQQEKSRNQAISQELSRHIPDIKAIRQTTITLRKRTHRLKKTASGNISFSVKSEAEIKASCEESVQICKRLKRTFQVICKDHFWLRLKGNKLDRLLDDTENNIIAIHDNLQRFFTATEWQLQVAEASNQPNWNNQLAENPVMFSANDMAALENALDEIPELTPAQLKAQQRYLAHKKAI